MKNEEISLADVQVGDRVWLDFLPAFGSKRSHLTTITHIDKKGRLFICAPGKDPSNGKERFENWRYAFDPRTGKAAKYQDETMRAATPAELAEHDAAEQAEKDAAAKRVERAAFERKAIESYETQAAICNQILDIMRVYHEQEKTAYGVDTPAGLEHMGDVWRLFAKWEAALKPRP